MEFADDHSDLDILIVMDTDESDRRRLSKIYRAVSKVRILQDILVLTSYEFDRKDNSLSFTRRLSGREEQSIKEVNKKNNAEERWGCPPGHPRL